MGTFGWRRRAVEPPRSSSSWSSEGGKKGTHFGLGLEATVGGESVGEEEMWAGGGGGRE